jgi:hypothetical protein
VLARSFANVPAGVLVLSEFSGFYRVLNGAIGVNPFSQKQLQEALDAALELPSAGRRSHRHSGAGTQGWNPGLALPLPLLNRHSGAGTQGWNPGLALPLPLWGWNPTGTQDLHCPFRC